MSASKLEVLVEGCAEQWEQVEQQIKRNRCRNLGHFSPGIEARLLGADPIDQLAHAPADLNLPVAVSLALTVRC
jgi:hypothetical protein